MENFNFPFHNGNTLENSNGLNRRTTSSWSCMQPRACAHCNRTFSNKFNLKQHIENVHTPSQALPCHICKRSFKNKWYLRKHSVTAHGAPLRRIKTSGGKIVYVNEATSITPFYLNNKVDVWMHIRYGMIWLYQISMLYMWRSFYYYCSCCRDFRPLLIYRWLDLWMLNCVP